MLALAATTLLLLAGCGDDKKEDPKPTFNTVELEFQHNAPGNTTPLRLNTAYQTATGQGYRLALLTYYVSNVKLIRADGTAWVEPRSYHLIKVAGAPADNPIVVLDSIPFGSFASIEFGIGVDTTANHTGDRRGALSPDEGMLWNWTTGYKFWVIEGDFLPVGAAPAIMTHHIGFDPQYRTVRLALPQAATVAANIAPEVRLYADINRFFTGIDLTDNAQRIVTTSSPFLGRLADNQAALFSVERVNNDPE